MTDDELLRSITGADTEDLYHQHFLELPLANWVDVADEGLRMFNVIGDMDIEPDSPLHHLLLAIAAEAADAASRRIARTISADPELIKEAEWQDAGNQKIDRRIANRLRAALSRREKSLK